MPCIFLHRFDRLRRATYRGRSSEPSPQLRPLPAPGQASRRAGARRRGRRAERAAARIGSEDAGRAERRSGAVFRHDRVQRGTESQAEGAPPGGTFVVWIGALISAVPSPPSVGLWLRPTAVHGSGRAPAAEHTAAHGTHDGAPPVAAPATHDSPPPAATGSTRVAGAVSNTIARSVATAPRVSSAVSSARPAVSVREMRLISQARRALEDNDGGGDHEARLLLEAHARDFPRGRLAAEREALLRRIR